MSHNQPITRIDLCYRAYALQIEAYCQPLPPRSDTPRHERETIAVESIVKHVFGPHTHIGHRPDGSPMLILNEHKEATPSISISHSRDYAVVALCRTGHHIGVDIENCRRKQLERVAPRVLSHDEMEIYASSPHDLVKAWTLKEALYKCALTPGLDFSTDISLPLSGEAKARVAGMDADIIFSAPLTEDTFMSLVVIC